ARACHHRAQYLCCTWHRCELPSFPDGDDAEHYSTPSARPTPRDHVVATRTTPRSRRTPQSHRGSVDVTRGNFRLADVPSSASRCRGQRGFGPWRKPVSPTGVMPVVGDKTPRACGSTLQLLDHGRQLLEPPRAASLRRTVPP